MKNYLFIFLLFQTSCVEKPRFGEDFQLKEGDFLFQDLDSSPLCDAIELVTPGYKKANLSHIGVIVETENPFSIKPDYNYKNHMRVLEAIPNKVQTTRLDSFLHRSFDRNNDPKVIVGRLKPKYSYTIENAVSFLKMQIGIDYDDSFLINNDSYYCSELIYDAFKKDTVFQLQPMTFLHPKTNDTLDIWKEYYKEIGEEIPQNKLGINPGLISLSDKIQIVHIYGIPDGMR